MAGQGLLSADHPSRRLAPIEGPINNEVRGSNVVYLSELRETHTRGFVADRSALTKERSAGMSHPFVPPPWRSPDGPKLNQTSNGAKVVVPILDSSPAKSPRSISSPRSSPRSPPKRRPSVTSSSALPKASALPQSPLKSVIVDRRGSFNGRRSGSSDLLYGNQGAMVGASPPVAEDSSIFAVCGRTFTEAPEMSEALAWCASPADAPAANHSSEQPTRQPLSREERLLMAVTTAPVVPFVRRLDSYSVLKQHPYDVLVERGRKSTEDMLAAQVAEEMLHQSPRPSVSRLGTRAVDLRVDRAVRNLQAVNSQKRLPIPAPGLSKDVVLNLALGSNSTDVRELLRLARPAPAPAPEAEPEAVPDLELMPPPPKADSAWDRLLVSWRKTGPASAAAPEPDLERMLPPPTIQADKPPPLSIRCCPPSMAMLMIALAASCLLALGIISESPSSWWSSTMQPLGGLYVVEGYDGKSWAGTRFVTDAYGSVSGPNVTVIGSDDGQTFWSIHGHLTGGFTSAALQLAPTPEDEAGTARAHRSAIVWNDGRKWTRLEAPPSAGMLLPQAAGVSQEGLEGVFHDYQNLRDVGVGPIAYPGFWSYTNHPAYAPRRGGTLRAFSDRAGLKRGDDLTIIGCDEPGFFFMLKGRLVDRGASRYEVDFFGSRTGDGPATRLEGTYDRHGLLRWSDGNYYRRVDFVTAP